MDPTTNTTRRAGHAWLRAELTATVFAGLFVTTLLSGPPPDAPLVAAARRGDVALVRELLSKGADVNSAEGDGMTALHWASLQGNADLVEVLLYAGANPGSRTRLGAYTPLHLAARNGRRGAVRALLRGGADAGAVTASGATPLHLAAAAGDAAVVEALLDHGADPDARETAHGQTPLMFAASAGRLEAVELLLGRGADPSLQTEVVDYAALGRADADDRQRRMELVAALRKANGEQTPPAATPYAGESPPSGGRGREPGQSDRPAVEGSKEAAVPDPAAELKGEAAVPDPAAELKGEEPPRPLSYNDLVGRQGGMTALHYAVRDGREDVVRALLAAGAGIDGPTGGDRSTPLLLAAINGRYDLGMLLLERGADPNLASEDGATPLYATIANRWAPKALYPQPTAFRQQRTSYLEFMESLLRHGADPNARLATHIWYSSFNFDLLGVNFQGATPFWRAAYATDVPAMKLLVAYGADPTIPSTKPAERRRRSEEGEDETGEDPSGLPPAEVGGPGVPPLVAAAGVGYGRARAGNSHRHAPDGWLPAVRYLIEELGADPNARDHDGFTALHYAAARGDNRLIDYLVSRGADVTLVARTGQTTVDMANGPIQRVQPFPETIALLESLGAKNNHKCVSC